MMWCDHIITVSAVVRPVLPQHPLRAEAPPGRARLVPHCVCTDSRRLSRSASAPVAQVAHHIWMCHRQSRGLAADQLAGQAAAVLVHILWMLAEHLPGTASLHVACHRCCGRPWHGLSRAAAHPLCGVTVERTRVCIHPVHLVHLLLRKRVAIGRAEGRTEAEPLSYDSILLSCCATSCRSSGCTCADSLRLAVHLDTAVPWPSTWFAPLLVRGLRWRWTTGRAGGQDRQVCPMMASAIIQWHTTWPLAVLLVQGWVSPWQS